MEVSLSNASLPARPDRVGRAVPYVRHIVPQATISRRLLKVHTYVLLLGAAADCLQK